MTSRLKLELLALKLLLLLDLLLFQLLSGLLNLALLFFLLLTDFLLHFFHFFVHVFVHLELLELFLVSFFHGLIPVIARFTIHKWIHVKIVLVVTDKDSVTVLKLIRVFKHLTVHPDLVLAWILFVRYDSSCPVITIEVQATLLICDTNTLKRDGRSKFSILFTHVVVTLVKCVFDHATHTRILIDVANLRYSFQACLLGKLLLLFTVLLLKFTLEFEPFCLDLGEGFFLLLNLPLQFFIGFATSTTTTTATTRCTWDSSTLP